VEPHAASSTAAERTTPRLMATPRRRDRTVSLVFVLLSDLLPFMVI
jgi:hypothetical protein